MSRSDEILNNYKHLNPGVKSNLYRIINHGKLSGTGKFIMYPVDQGFEHGPIKSFEPNPAGYDPIYHAEFAIESGVNAYAAPLGFIQVAASEYPGQIPLILKMNSNDSLFQTKEPTSGITSTIKSAIELGCVAIGFTIYPGTETKNIQMQQLKSIIQKAHDSGLVTVVWSYPRGNSIVDPTNTEVTSYAAHIASQLGADIIKVKPPVTSPGALNSNIQKVVKSAFNGKRIVIFSGGNAKEKSAVLNEISEINKGGGFGSIIGRNVFQRTKEKALGLIDEIVNIYQS